MPTPDDIREQIRTLSADDNWLEREAARRKEAKELRAAELATLPPKGKRPHCRYCDHELGVYIFYAVDSERKFGYEGNNKFCTLRCGFNWAVART